MQCVIRDRQFDITLEATPTADAIRNALPIEATVHRWGGEVYCLTDIRLAQEPEARALMAVGEIAYWPPQGAIALFFGPTPVSTDERPRAYSSCNVFGTFDVDLDFLGSIEDGERIRFIQ